MRCRLVLGVLAVILVSACGKGNPMNSGGGSGGTGGGTTSSGTMTAQIDGSAFSSTTAAGTLSGGILAISGGDTSGRSIAFAFFPTGTGTHTTSGNVGTNFIVVVNFQGFSAVSGNGSGTITLTTLTSNKAIGTFSCVAMASSGGAVGSKNVTNGTFNVTF